MMKLLVTGGAGFIGSNFVRYTLKHRPKWHVTVLDKLTYAGNLNSLDGLPGSRYKFIKADICDELPVNKAIANCDTVVHFAAESHVDNSIESPLAFIESNVFGTYTVLQAIRKFKKRLHHISTDEVFGDLSLNDPKFNEESQYKPSSPYSAPKASSDHLVRAWIKTYGIEATISNCSNNYGPYQHVEKFIPRQVTEILENRKPKVYGQGANIRDWIHAEDHSSAILTILEKGRIGETYLVGVNGERTNKQVVELILELMGKQSNDYELVSDRPGHDLRYAVDATKIKEELGWQPSYSDFKRGLKSTIDWYSANQLWWKNQKASITKKSS